MKTQFSLFLSSGQRILIVEIGIDTNCQTYRFYLFLKFNHKQANKIYVSVMMKQTGLFNEFVRLAVRCSSV